MGETLKRYDKPDSEWSDPGSTFGIADRWTTRHLCGLWLTAGDNRRKNALTFIAPLTAQPWHVYALGPHKHLPEGHWTMVEIASGTAGSVALAKQAAEEAARTVEIP